MKYAEIKNLPTNEIESRIKEEKTNLQRAKFSSAVSSSSIESLSYFSKTRKDIARLMTELNVRNTK